MKVSLTKEQTVLDNLKAGDVFTCGIYTYMKTDTIREDYKNVLCVDLGTGRVEYICDLTWVERQGTLKFS